jgi:hypothetical protein
MLSVMEKLGVAYLLMIAALGCGDVPVPECDEMRACKDSARPFCDLDGTYGEAGTCIATPTTTLTVKFEGTGAGKVTLDPAALGEACDSTTKTCEYTVEIGAQIKLTAAASSGSTFVDWTGACTGINADCMFTVDTAAEVVATIGTPGEYLWSEAFVGGGAEGAAIAMDDNGDIAVAFRNIGNIDVRGTQYSGNSDLLVVKFRRDKSLAWAKQFGGDTSYMEPGDLAFAPNGDVLVVAVGQSVTLDGETVLPAYGSFVARLDGETGAKELLKAVGSGTELRAVGVTGVGDEIVVTTRFSGTADLGMGTLTAGMTDGAIVWFSATGTPLRQLWMTGGGNEYTGLSVDSSGNLFVGGFYTGSIDLAPGAPGGDLPAATGAGDGFLGQFTPTGTFQWGQRYSGAGNDYIGSPLIGPTGSLTTSGSSDMGMNLNPGGTGGDVTGNFIARFTPDGALRWSYTKITSYVLLAVDGRDQVYFTTFCDAASNFGGGVVAGTGRFCAVRLDDRANFVWAKRFPVSDSGAQGGFRPAELAAAPNGMHAFAGVTYIDVSLGGPTISGNSSGFLYVGGP